MPSPWGAVALLLSVTEAVSPAAVRLSSDAAADDVRAEAEKRLAEGRELEQKDTAESLRAALDRYLESRRLFETAGVPSGVARAELHAAVIRDALGDVKGARAGAETAVRLYEALGDARGRALALKKLGELESVLGESEPALRHLQEALALARSEPVPEVEAQVLFVLGKLHNDRGERGPARDLLERALALAEAASDERLVGEILTSLAKLHNNIGEPARAIELYTRAIETARRVPDRTTEAFATGNLGVVYQAIGEPFQALENYEKGLGLCRAVGNARCEAANLTNSCAVHVELSDHARLLEACEAALERWRAIGERSAQARTLGNLGRAYEGAGDLVRAGELYGDALRLAREASDRRSEANTLVYLGDLHALRGELDRALAFFELALPVCRAVKDARAEGFAERGVGAVRLRLGQWDLAASALERSLALARSVSDRRGEARGLVILGELQLAQDRADEAAETFARAHTMSRAVRYPGGEATAALGLARAERQKGRLAESLRHSEAAIAVVEGIRSRIPARELRTAYASSARDFYAFQIDLLMSLHREAPGQEYARRAFETSERIRARTLVESLRSAGVDPRAGVDPALLARERDLRGRLTAKADRWSRLLAGGASPTEAAAAEREVEGLERAYGDIRAEIERRNPDWARLLLPPPLHVEDVLRLLPEDTVLAEYFLGRERSFVWTVTASSVGGHELPGRAEIGELASRFAASVRTSAGTDATRSARALADVLIGPWAASLQNRSLVVVADGELHAVPFSALPLPVLGPDREKGGRSALVLDHAPVSLPSAAMLSALRERPASTDRRSGIAVIADPVFEPSDPRVRKGAVPPSPAVGVGGEVVRATPYLRSPLEGKPLQRLPFTRREATAILAHYPAGDRLQALGFEARRTPELLSRLGDYRVIHFATHSLLDDERPGLSTVVLSLVDEGGRPQDGFLRLHDVYELRLRADLVVLSACQTGLGRLVEGEGMVGLTRGFLHAGARGVLSTLWKVDDEATAALMARFYAELNKPVPVAPALALHSAQASLRKVARFRHPYYWAGFVLQGEWR